MKAVLGADHAGCVLKNAAKQYLIQKQIEVLDLGTDSDKEPVDYPDIGIKAAKMVANGAVSYTHLDVYKRQGTKSGICTANLVCCNRHSYAGAT